MYIYSSQPVFSPIQSFRNATHTVISSTTCSRENEQTNERTAKGPGRAGRGGMGAYDDIQF